MTLSYSSGKNQSTLMRFSYLNSFNSDFILLSSQMKELLKYTYHLQKTSSFTDEMRFLKSNYLFLLVNMNNEGYRNQE